MTISAAKKQTGIDPEQPRNNLHKKTALITRDEKVLHCETDHGKRPINLLEMFSAIEKVRNDFPDLNHQVPVLKVKAPNKVFVKFQSKESHILKLLVTNCDGGDLCIEVRRPINGFRGYNLERLKKVIGRRDEGQLPVLTLSNSVGIVNFI